MAVSAPAADREQKIDYALSHWQKAVPIAGTIAERYLSETRGIDIGRLPTRRIRELCAFIPTVSSDRSACPVCSH